MLVGLAIYLDRPAGYFKYPQCCRSSVTLYKAFNDKSSLQNFVIFSDSSRL